MARIDIAYKYGEPHMILYPRHDLSGEALKSLQSIPGLLSEKGWFTLPDVDAEGNHKLEVWGFEKGQHVMDILAHGGLVKGVAIETAIDGDKTPQQDLIARAGKIYLVADALAMLSGKISGEENVFQAGVFSMLTSGMLVYGRHVHEDEPVGQFIHEVKKLLAREGINISNEWSPEKLAEKNGFKKAVHHVLGNYGVEMVIAADLASSYKFVKGGLGKGYNIVPEKQNKIQPGLLAQGAVGLVTGTNALITRLLLENKHRMDPAGSLIKLTDILEKISIPARAIGNAAANVAGIFEGIVQSIGLWRNQGSALQDRSFWGAVLKTAAFMAFLTGNIQYSRGKQVQGENVSIENAIAATAVTFRDLPVDVLRKVVPETANLCAKKDPQRHSGEYYCRQLYDKISALKNSPFLLSTQKKSRTDGKSAYQIHAAG